jgi:hypothetical protein
MPFDAEAERMRRSIENTHRLNVTYSPVPDGWIESGRTPEDWTWQQIQDHKRNLRLEHERNVAETDARYNALMARLKADAEARGDEE